MTRIELETAIRAAIYDNTTGEVSGKEVADSIMMSYDASTVNGATSTGVTSVVSLTDIQIKTQYENNKDTECFTPTEQTKLGSIPDMPTTDGDYVLNNTGGVFTWGLNSGGALVYDAHILGSTLAGNITLSPFVKHGGMDEETRNRGVDFADGGIYLVYPMYQAGMSAAHISDTSPMFLADDYANALPVGLFNGAGTSMGSAFTGKQMNAAIAAGNILQIQYDSSSSKLLIEVT